MTSVKNNNDARIYLINQLSDCVVNNDLKAYLILASSYTTGIASERDLNDAGLSALKIASSYGREEMFFELFDKISPSEAKAVIDNDIKILTAKAVGYCCMYDIHINLTISLISKLKSLKEAINVVDINDDRFFDTLHSYYLAAYDKNKHEMINSVYGTENTTEEN